MRVVAAFVQGMNQRDTLTDNSAHFVDGIVFGFGSGKCDMLDASGPLHSIIHKRRAAEFTHDNGATAPVRTTSELEGNS